MIPFNVHYRRFWAHLLARVSEGYYVCGVEGWGVPSAYTNYV